MGPGGSENFLLHHDHPLCLPPSPTPHYSHRNLPSIPPAEHCPELIESIFRRQDLWSLATSSPLCRTASAEERREENH